MSFLSAPLALTSSFSPSRALVSTIRFAASMFEESDEPATVAVERTYRDESDLAMRLDELDEEFDVAKLTVAIVLDDATRQAFSSQTLRRSRVAFRLILTALYGDGPAPSFIGDLAARAEALGWRQIVWDRSGDRAIREAVDSTSDDETCVVFRPAWLETPVVPFRRNF